MFTNDRRQIERTGKYGTSRQEYIQELVTEFQDPKTNIQTKQQIAANLANFAYDPYNYTILRKLNVLELFIDCLTEDDEKLVEFGAGGVCNAVADPENVKVVVECGGVEVLKGCLSGGREGKVVGYVVAALWFLGECGVELGVGEEVGEVVRKVVDGGGVEVEVGVKNVAKVFLEKYCGGGGGNV